MGKRGHSLGCTSVILVVVLVVVGILVAYRCQFRVPKGHVAVLMREIGGVGDGIQSQVVREGLHAYNPLVTDYFIVNTKIQTLVFGMGQSGTQRGRLAPGATDYWRRPATSYWDQSRRRAMSEAQLGRFNVEMRFPRGPIRAKTKDGEDVNLRATLVYHVSEEDAPRFVRFAGGDVQSFLSLYLVPGARSVIRTVFGELAGASFFDASERASKAQACLSALSELLGTAGVAVESFTLDDFTFDQDFHTYLQDVKILNQQIGSVGEQAAATLGEVEQELERERADAKASIADAQRRLEAAKADAESTVQQMTQRADAVRRQLMRQADLARQRAESLSGPEGELTLKLELVRALKGKPMIILPDAAAADLGQSFSELLKALSEPAAYAGPTLRTPE